MRWFKLEDPNAIDYPRAWLKKVAGRLAINHFRRQSLRTTVEKPLEPEKMEQMAVDMERDLQRLEIEDALEQMAVDMERDLQRLEIEDALSRLPWRDQLLLKLRMEGKSYQEVAQLLDLTPSSIGTMLARAMQRFRVEYEGKEAGQHEVSGRGNVIRLFG